MSRKIKFRIWDKECSCWDREPENKLLSSIVCSMEENGLTYNLEGSYLQSLRFEKVQSTGLIDCEGKEIWEGDMCQYVYKDRHGINFDGVAWIYWDTANCGFALDVIKDSRNDTKSKMSLFYAGGRLKLKIIGNRFENPELLRQEESIKGQDLE